MGKNTKKIRKRCKKYEIVRAVIKKCLVVFFTFSDPAKKHLSVALFLQFHRESILDTFSLQKMLLTAFFTISPKNRWAHFFGAKRRNKYLGSSVEFSYICFTFLLRFWAGTFF